MFTSTTINYISPVSQGRDSCFELQWDCGDKTSLSQHIPMGQSLETLPNGVELEAELTALAIIVASHQPFKSAIERYSLLKVKWTRETIPRIGTNYNYRPFAHSSENRAICWPHEYTGRERCGNWFNFECIDDKATHATEWHHFRESSPEMCCWWNYKYQLIPFPYQITSIWIVLLLFLRLSLTTASSIPMMSTGTTQFGHFRRTTTTISSTDQSVHPFLSARLQWTHYPPQTLHLLHNCRVRLSPSRAIHDNTKRSTIKGQSYHWRVPHVIGRSLREAKVKFIVLCQLRRVDR